MLRDARILEDTLAPADRLALDEFVRGARRKLGDRLLRLALFGSRARSDHDPDSDIDLLAVVVADRAEGARAEPRQLAAEVERDAIDL